MKKKYEKIYNKISSTNGFGVKEIAGTLAVVVIIGVAVTVVNSNMNTWIGDIWDTMFDHIKTFTNASN